MQGFGVADQGGELNGVGNAAGHPATDDFAQQARNILTGNFRQAVLAAELLVNDTVAGRQWRNGDIPLPARLPRRPATFRRQTANPVSENLHATEYEDGEMRT